MSDKKTVVNQFVQAFDTLYEKIGSPKDLCLDVARGYLKGLDYKKIEEKTRKELSTSACDGSFKFYYNKKSDKNYDLVVMALTYLVGTMNPDKRDVTQDKINICLQSVLGKYLQCLNSAKKTSEMGSDYHSLNLAERDADDSAEADRGRGCCCQ